MLTRQFLVFLFVIVANCSVGYNQSNVDSLRNVWSDESLHDTIRMEAMAVVSGKIYLSSNPDSSYFIGQQLYKLAKERSNKRYMARSLNIQGIAADFLGNYSLAMDRQIKSLKKWEELDDCNGIGDTKSNIARLYQLQGSQDKSIVYFKESLKAYETINDSVMVASVYIRIGNRYNGKEDYDSALIYYNKSKTLSEEINDEGGVAMALSIIGLTYNHKLDFEKALKYCNESLELYTKIGSKPGMGQVYNFIEAIYFRQEKYPEAIEYLKKTLSIYREIGDHQGVVWSLLNIGSIYQKIGNSIEAINYGEEGIKLARELKFLHAVKVGTERLWVIYKDRGNTNKALEMHELYVETKDSLDNKGSQKEIMRQEFKYQYEKQAAADSLIAIEAIKIKDAELAKEKAQNIQQTQQSYFLYSGLFLALVFGGFIFNRFRVTNKQKDIIENQKKKVDEAFEELEEKNTEILDSISYAKRIQNAILPPQKIVKEYLNNSFILYKPKDIVAGDFYWMSPPNLPQREVGASSKGEGLKSSTASSPSERTEERILFAAADCTGHGVPGALVSVICNNALNRSVKEFGLTDPGQILDKTREIVIQEFEKSEEEVKDGMDIALVSLEYGTAASSKQTTSSKIASSDNYRSPSGRIEDGTTQNSCSILKYAGAHNPLWIVRKDAAVIEEIKANKQPIGQFIDPQPYTTHEIDLNEGDSFYIFSDGYVDQFGGEKGKKFKAKAFRELLLSIQDKEMEEQKDILNSTFENWRGDLEQIDDVCVIGVRL